MKRIGLTGNIGTGKTTVARVFSCIGIPVYHADTRAKLFLDSEKVIVQLETHFGSAIITRDKTVDRKKLASIVFSEQSKLSILNSIIHPLVKADFEEWCLLQTKKQYIIHEAAILFESGFNSLFDANILVVSPECLCLSRVMERDKITEEMVKLRMQNQWDQEQKKNLADYLIINDENSLLIPQVLSIHNQIIRHT